MTDAAARVAERLAEIWRSSRGIVLERMEVLRAAHASLCLNREDAVARANGREAAHKLSGVLGVFGLPEGSEIAATMEELLKSSNPIAPAEIETLGAQIARLDAVIASKPA